MFGPWRVSDSLRIARLKIRLLPLSLEFGLRREAVFLVLGKIARAVENVCVVRLRACFSRHTAKMIVREPSGWLSGSAPYIVARPLSSLEPLPISCVEQH